MIIPLVFASSGNGTWLAYIFATVALLFVTAQINTFASRSASPGALYTFTAQGLGERWGALSGWSLFLAYVFTAAATFAGFTNYAGVVLEAAFGIKMGIGTGFLIMIGNIVLCWMIAWRDIQLSTRAMLILEFASVGLILVIAALFFFHTGQIFDGIQLGLKGVTATGLRMALVLALFSFVGFESATALGGEAKDPLKTIPFSVLSSVIIVGAFFTFMAYILVMAFHGLTTALDKTASPLVDLAALAGHTELGVFLAFGALIGQFACALASINAASRVMYSMAQKGFFHSASTRVHEKHSTPHIAVSASMVLAGVGPLLLVILGCSYMEIFGYLGSIATFGFLLSYVLVSVSAPLFLKKRNELKNADIVKAVIAFLLLLIPIVGSVYPEPEPPYNFLPYVFLVLMAFGGFRIFWLSRGKKNLIHRF